MIATQVLHLGPESQVIAGWPLYALEELPEALIATGAAAAAIELAPRLSGATPTISLALRGSGPYGNPPEDHPDRVGLDAITSFRSGMHSTARRFAEGDEGAGVLNLYDSQLLRRTLDWLTAPDQLRGLFGKVPEYSPSEVVFGGARMLLDRLHEAQSRGNLAARRVFDASTTKQRAVVKKLPPSVLNCEVEPKWGRAKSITIKTSSR